MNTTPENIAAGTQSINGIPLDQVRRLPLLIESHGLENGERDALVTLWQESRASIMSQLHDYGAILFRGFTVDDQERFQAVLRGMEQKLASYIDGNSPRKKLAGGIYTSTEYPPEFFISMHNELSYSANWPARLFFCCVIQPSDGGQTPLLDSRVLLRHLPIDLIEEFRAKGVQYIRNLHGGVGLGPSWMDVFETDQRATAEDFATNSELSLKWQDDGSVTVRNTRPAVAVHPITKEEVWFNQAEQFHPSSLPDHVYSSLMSLYKEREECLPHYVTYGDGSLIPRSHLDRIRSVSRELLVTFDWRKGDLLMVDNMLAAHGRMPFHGPRRILVSMSSD